MQEIYVINLIPLLHLNDGYCLTAANENRISFFNSCLFKGLINSYVYKNERNTSKYNLKQNKEVQPHLLLCLCLCCLLNICYLPTGRSILKKKPVPEVLRLVRGRKPRAIPILRRRVEFSPIRTDPQGGK